MILRLKNIRLEAGITQKEIASILKISEFTYSHYETEYVLIPIKHLLSFCTYFHVSIDYTFKLTDNKIYPNTNLNIDINKTTKNLKEFRKDNKLTQEKLAEFLNIGKGTIADYERGRYLIATPFLYQICKKYNISADYLLGKIDNPKYLP